MTDDSGIRDRLLLAAQRALLGEVSPSLRAVTCDWEGAEIRLQFVFDGEISEHDMESARVVGSEIIAEFSAPWRIDEDIRRLDYPSDRRKQALPLWVFARRETPQNERR